MGIVVCSLFKGLLNIVEYIFVLQQALACASAIVHLLILPPRRILFRQRHLLVANAFNFSHVADDVHSVFPFFPHRY